MNPHLKKFSQMDMKKVLMIGVGLAVFYYIALFDGGESIDIRVAQLETQIQQEEQAQAETNALIKQGEGITNEVSQSRVKFENLVKKQPATTTTDTVSKILQDVAVEAQVNIKQMRPAKTDAGEYVEEIPINITAEGGFNDFALFIYKLSKEDILLRVTRLTIRNSEKNDFTKGKLRLDATISSYRYVGDKK